MDRSEKQRDGMRTALVQKVNGRVLRDLFRALLLVTMTCAVLNGDVFAQAVADTSGNGTQELAPTPPPPPSMRRQSQAPADPLREEQREQARQRQLYNIARQHENRGNHEQALRLYRQLREANPGRQSYFEGIRRNLIDLGRYDEATDLIEQEIERTRGRRSAPDLYADLGEAHYLAGRREMAEEAWDRAIHTAGRAIQGYQALSNVFIRLRLVDRAVEILREGREEMGQETLFAVNLASLLRSRMDWEGAAREYILGMRGSTGMASYARRGLAGFPDTEEANQAARRAVEEELELDLESPWPGYRMSLREILVEQSIKNGDFQAALEQMRLLDSEAERPGERLVRFAAQAMHEGEEEVARQALDTAAERLADPTGRAVVDLARASLATSSGRYERARELYDAVLERGVGREIMAVALINRGVLALEKLGQPESAVEDFQRVLGLNWEDQGGTLRYHQARALIRMGEMDRAAALLDSLGEDLGSQEARRRPGGASAGNEGFGGIEEVTPGQVSMLGARLALWRNDQEGASEQLERLLVRPSGDGMENDALLLSKLVSQAEDSAGLARYARANRALFLGDTLRALQLCDSLAETAEGELSREAGFTAITLRMAADDTSVVDEVADFAARWEKHPRVEEAWFELGKWWHRRGIPVEAAVAYEMILFDFPDGLLQHLARLELDRLAAEQGGQLP